MARFTLLSLFLALLSTAAVAQEPRSEQGRPYHVESYSVSDYRAHDQNWAITEDERGVIYVANHEGVLEFDGRTWRTIGVPGQRTRSLVTDEGGKIYVGGSGEVGYLAPDSLGTMEYRSLVHTLPEEHREFADIWTTLATEDGVYFQSFDRIMRWDGSEMQVWIAETRFHKAFVVNDVYYLRQDDVGLMTIEDDTLRLRPNGERFATHRIDAMLPFGQRALVVTRNEGLLLKQGDEYRAFHTEADAYLRDERVYHAAPLSDSTYALTTISGTVVVMGTAGEVLRVLDEDVGLRSDDLVLYAYADRQGGLWLALDTGLLRVDVPTPLTTFGQGLGLAGTVYSAQRANGDLYVATSQGLFQLRSANVRGSLLNRHARFEPVGGLRQQVWSILGVGDALLVAANDGVYEITGGTSRMVLTDRSFVLVRSQFDPGLVYVGTKGGLAILQLREGQWNLIGRVKGLEEVEVRSLLEADDGSLWMGGVFDGALRAWLDGGELVRTERYGEAEGLPARTVSVYEKQGQLVAQSSAGIYYMQETAGHNRFVRDERLNALVGLEREGAEGNHLINTKVEGQVWVVKEGRVHVYQEAEGGYKEVTPPILRLDGISYQFMYVEGDGTAWINGAEGIIRYEPSIEKNYAVSYPALVRQVTTGRNDLLFGGASRPGDDVPRLTNDRNSLRFKFSAPTFNAPEKTEYQYWLEGFDDGWSDWALETTKEYTNLPERTYRFQVRARNAQGVVSRVGIYAFEVLPPWYRTWWAYSLYIATFIAIVWGYGDFRIRQHRRMLAHEQAINVRLDTANARLREANDRLHHADKLKDDFLANTSHELRTPLTAILGFAGVLQEELSGELRHFAELIQRGGERLLDTVNAMLDMARLQADMVDVQLGDLDVVEAARDIVQGLEPLAQEKGLFVRVMPDTHVVRARMDRFCLERILVNLVGNAIKFTDEGGVTVLVDGTGDEVHLVVRDTGIGIEQKALPNLFDDFQQASTGYGRTHEGNGLGLAITQRIVEMLGGAISVESKVGGGTVFRISLPRYDQREVPQAEGEGDAISLLESSTRLLLIEDPERPQVRLRDLLGAQCHLDVVVGAEAGLEAVGRMEYDGILVDGHLTVPESSNSFLEMLRATPAGADIKAVAVTGFKMPGDYERFIGLGYAGHIGKPFTARRLMMLLEGVLTAAEPAHEEG